MRYTRQAGVLFAEIAIDWVKHSFITKFNRLSADVYTGYGHILVHDVLSSRRRIEVRIGGEGGGRAYEPDVWTLTCSVCLRPRLPRLLPCPLDQASLDPTHAASRRMGFAAIPLTCLVRAVPCVCTYACGRWAREGVATPCGLGLSPHWPRLS